MVSNEKEIMLHTDCICVDVFTSFFLPEINEMKIWQLILASHGAAKRDKSQMFYFTPTFNEKLELIKENASSNMCVHVCGKGSISMTGSRLGSSVPTLKKVLQAARKG